MKRSFQWGMVLSAGCLGLIVFAVYTYLNTASEIQGIIRSAGDNRESGRVVMRQLNGQTVADLTMNEYKNAEIQSVSVVSGTCGDRKAVVYHLTYLYTGYSNTTLDIRLQTLVRQLPLAVIVTKTKDWDSPVIFCGDLYKV